MKIGFLSLPLTGHLNPMTALARKLQSRGREVVFIGVPDIEPVVLSLEGFDHPTRRSEAASDHDRHASDAVVETTPTLPRSRMGN
jgi:UDP:flavonoid glycosyltransferase YjiC (YdhE family)